MKTADEVLEWKGFGNGIGRWPSKCRLRLYEHGNLTVCVATELPDNNGTSVTNAAEWIAAIAFERHKLDPRRTIWIEHYPPRGVEETFDLVMFDVQLKPNRLDPKTVDVRFERPTWKRMPREHVESLCGEVV